MTLTMSMWPTCSVMRVGVCTTRFTTLSKVQSKMIFVGSQRRRGLSRDAGLKFRSALRPTSVSRTGVGRFHAACTGSFAIDSGVPRAPGKAR
jgi:hypothetical protein